MPSPTTHGRAASQPETGSGATCSTSLPSTRTGSRAFTACSAANSLRAGYCHRFLGGGRRPCRPKGVGSFFSVRLRGGLGALGCTLILGSVVARNFWVGGEFFATTSQFGTNFFIGNHRGASGRYEPLRWGNGSAESEQIDAVDLAEKALGRPLSSGQVSRSWFARGWSDIRSQPEDWLHLMGHKSLLLVNSVEIAETEERYTWAEGSWVLAAITPILHLGLLTPLAAAGIVVTWSSFRRLWILHAILLTYAETFGLCFVNARYRYPLVPMLMLFAGAAIAHPWRQSFSQGRYRQGAAPPAVARPVRFLPNRPPLGGGAVRRGPAPKPAPLPAERGGEGPTAQGLSP